MPKSKMTSQTRWRKIWKDWGLFLILVAVILIAGVVALIVRASHGQQRPEIDVAAPYRIYFTQGDSGEAAPDGLEAVILKDIAAARASVDVATPGLDLAGLAGALVAAQNRGVQVRVLEDAAAQETAAVMTVTEQLRAAGIEVVLRPAPGALGGAFIVVDQRLVWAGSWDLSQQGLETDDAVVLRWDIPQMAVDFHDEFEEMFVDGAYGPGSPANTKNKYLAIAVPSENGVTTTARGMSIYLTPEDDPIGQVLQSMAGVRGEIILLTEAIDDMRLGDRLIAESGRKDVIVWGVVGRDDASSPIVAQMRAAEAGIAEYHGDGVLRENVIVVDGETVCIFSQPLLGADLVQNDGYVIVLADRDVGAIMQREFRRLAQP
jgi:hypothetical protein